MLYNIYIFQINNKDYTMKRDNNMIEDNKI